MLSFSGLGAPGVALSLLLACTGKPLEPRKLKLGDLINGDSFSETSRMDAAASSDYDFDPSKIELVGGVARLKGPDQTDDDDSVTGFGGALGRGATWSGSELALTLGSSGGCDARTTNCLELHPHWVPQPAQLLGLWNFNGSGSIANSANHTAVVGPNLTASNSNSSGFSFVPGKLLQSSSLDGADDTWIGTLNGSALNTLSIAFWMKPQGLPGTRGVFQWANMPLASFPFFLIQQDGQQIRFYLDGDYRVTSPSLRAQQWTHVALTLSSAHLWSAYINGELVGTYQDDATRMYQSNGTHVYFGNGFNGYFPGELDDAAIWNSTLSASEVFAIFQRTSSRFAGAADSRILDSGIPTSAWTQLAWMTGSPFGKPLPDFNSGSIQNESSGSYPHFAESSLMNNILGLWHLDEAAGTSGSGSVIDRSGQANHGTPSNVVFGKAGNFFRAPELNGSNASISTQVLPISNQFTLSAWIWIREHKDYNQALMSMHPGAGNYYGFLVDQTGRIHAQVSNSSFGDGTLTSATTIPIQTWVHVAFVYDGTLATQRSKLFINGVQDANTANLVGGAGTTGTPLLIGRDGVFGREFNGRIDEVGVWSRPLIMDEVKALHGRGSARVSYQVRSCMAADCSDGTWKGPDGTSLTTFSEIHNTTVPAAAPSGVVRPQSAALPLQSFTSPVGAGRYFQYRVILETQSTLPEAQPTVLRVQVGPGRYSNDGPTIATKTPIPYLKLDSFSSNLGTTGCEGGVRYSISLNSNVWLFWSGSQWLPSDGSFAQSSTATDMCAGFSQLTGISSPGVQIRAHLGSDGDDPCELDQWTLSGER